jgi:hypothetical protein
MESIDTKIMYFAVEKWQTNDFPFFFFHFPMISISSLKLKRLQNEQNKVMDLN